MIVCPSCETANPSDGVHCRKCERYLWGGPVAAALFGGLPPRLARSPGVATTLLGILLVYVGSVGAAGVDSALGFSGYSLRMLGAMHPPAIMQGDVWRWVTGAWLHHDPIHLLFNSAALASIGPALERAYGRRRFLVLWFFAGVVSMIGSFAWGWGLGGAAAARTAVGASGALCGVIGATLVVAYRLQNSAALRALRGWVISIAIFGVAIPGIDNAAHLAGALAGAAFAWLFVWRDVTKPLPPEHAGWRGLAVASTLAVALSFVAVGGSASSAPIALERDAQARRLLMIEVGEASPWRSSSQYDALLACERALERTHGDVDAIEARCVPATRMVPHHVIVWDVLAVAAEARGDAARARRLKRIAARLAHGEPDAARLPAPSEQEGSGSSS